MNKKLTKFQKYLAIEVGVDLKACLYFFVFVFYYSMFRLWAGLKDASILHLAEIIASTYIMCYLQYFFMNNFDEGDKFGTKEIVLSVIGTAIYTALSWLLGWLDRNVAWTVGFAFYVMVSYLCVYLSYKIKREFDGRMLNADLQNFKDRNNKYE